MKEIVLVRNAQTLAAIEERHEGQVDFDLTPTGKDQAKLVARWLSGMFSFDFVLSSPLLRSFYTAIPIADSARQRVEVDADLNPPYLGVLEGMRVADALARFPLPAVPRLPHEAVERGETRLEFRARVERAWWKLVQRLKDGQRCCLVAPSATIDELFRCFLGVSSTCGIKLQSDESAVHYWQFGDSERRVYASNLTDHLNDLSVN